MGKKEGNFQKREELDLPKVSDLRKVLRRQKKREAESLSPFSVLEE